MSDVFVEYIGPAERQVGTGTVHEVRAFWDARDGLTEKQVAAEGKSALVSDGKILDHVEYIGRDLDTYRSPRLAAVLRYRALTPDEFRTRTELRSRRYTSCAGCGEEEPGQLVCRENGTEEALCFGCWNPVKYICKVLHWIKADGKLQLS